MSTRPWRRRARLGLWSEPAYAERAAYRTRELMRYRSTYQLVMGRVARVATAGGRRYLNFGTDWREDFTVGIASAALRADPGWAAALQAMEGRVLRVRGWIERRNGPLHRGERPSSDRAAGGDRRAFLHTRARRAGRRWFRPAPISGGAGARCGARPDRPLRRRAVAVAAVGGVSACSVSL